MEHHPPFELMPLSRVEPGRLIAITIRTQTELAMTADPIANGSPPAVVILTGDEAFSLVDGAALSRPLVLVYPGARVLLPTDPQATRVHSAASEPPYGAITFVGGSPHVVARSGRQSIRHRNRRFCALEDGATIDDSADRYTWFMRWSVAVQDADGRWREMREIEAEAPSED